MWKLKQAIYVSTNIEVNQEFNFAAPETKLKVNNIYNASWFGIVFYNLYSKESVKTKLCYNRSINIMLDFPYGARRRLIEPLSEQVESYKKAPADKLWCLASPEHC